MRVQVGKTTLYCTALYIFVIILATKYKIKTQLDLNKISGQITHPLEKLFKQSFIISFAVDDTRNKFTISSTLMRILETSRNVHPQQIMPHVIDVLKALVQYEPASDELGNMLSFLISTLSSQFGVLKMTSRIVSLKSIHYTRYLRVCDHLMLLDGGRVGVIDCKS